MNIIKSVFADDQVGGTIIDVGWKIPTLAAVLGFVIKTFFIISGLAAILFLVLGAFAWITSGGDKEKVSKAQEKIQSAIVGLIILVAVIAVIATIEQAVFKEAVCLGLTCDLKFPSLISPSGI